MSEHYAEWDNPIPAKSEFIIAFLESIIGGNSGLTAKEKTIIDRVLTKIYSMYLQNHCVL